MKRPILILSATLTLLPSSSWAQSGSNRWNFDNTLIKGATVKTHTAPRKDRPVKVSPNATPKQLMSRAEKRVDDANDAYLTNRTESDSIRREAAALYRHAQVRFFRQRRDDMALFAKAQALRQDGDYDAMAETLGTLLTKHRLSPIAPKTANTLGDHYFDVAKLGKARLAYERTLSGPPSVDGDYARYKLAWIAVNMGDCKQAFQRFEEVLRSKVVQPPTSPTAQNLREVALSDSVYCYDKVRRADQAVSYFSSAPVSKASRVKALERMARRYFIKEQHGAALSIYEKLRQWTADADKRREYSDRITELKRLIPSKGTQRP